MSAGADPVDLILTAIAAGERALAPPSDATKAPLVHDTFPGEPNEYPAFINVPRSGEPLHVENSVRMWKWTVDAILVFGAGDGGYANAAQRKWVPVVQNYFDTNSKLSNVVQLLEITGINFDPVTLNGMDYVAITFTFDAIVSEAYIFA